MNLQEEDYGDTDENEDMISEDGVENEGNLCIEEVEDSSSCSDDNQSIKEVRIAASGDTYKAKH